MPPQPSSDPSKAGERLLDGPRSPEYYEQKALDQLLAPVLTKALMQEKMKRTCMRTQATQTDPGLVRKSLPHLALSPTTDKTEMVSQGAQTNGMIPPAEGRRRLVKSLSEAAHYEGPDFDLYDLDGVPPPPPPPAKSIPQVLPLYLYHHHLHHHEDDDDDSPSLWSYSPYSLASLHGLQNGAESSLSDGGVTNTSPSLCKCHSLKDSAEDILLSDSPVVLLPSSKGSSKMSPNRRRFLTKTSSEGSIILLQEKRKALSMASGYMEVVDLSARGKEEGLIEPLCVDECPPYDLTRNLIFSQESLATDDTDEEVFHEHLVCPPKQEPVEPQRRRVSLRSNMYEDSPEPPSSENVPAEEEDEESLGLPDHKIRRKRDLGEESSPAGSVTSSDTAPPDEISPIESSCMTDTYSGVDALEVGDHQQEESVSESQVTVLQKTATLTSSSHLASDSENGSFHMTDPSSAATTPSTRHKSMTISESFEEEVEEELEGKQEKWRTVPNALSLSPVSDEQTSVSENAISDSNPTAEADEKNLASPPTDNESFCSARSDVEDKEKLIEKVARDLRERDLMASVRKLTSPESDSSSSHFTEQETSRSPASVGTNTITSRSDLSRTDSHATTTDQSETSEDYVTATENSVEAFENRRAIMTEERRVSSPPRLYYILEDEALLTPKAPNIETVSMSHEYSDASSLGGGAGGHTSDFDTQDLTSPDGDTTTSASYQIEPEDGLPGSIASQVEMNLSISSPPPPPANSATSSPAKRTYVMRKSYKEYEEAENRLMLNEKSISSDNLKEESEEEDDSSKEVEPEDIEKRTKDEVTDDSYLTQTGAIKKKFSNDRFSEESFDSNGRRQSLTEEQRERLKSGMKLDFPPGVTMYGPGLGSEENEDEEAQRRALEEGVGKLDDGMKMKKSVTIKGDLQSQPKEDPLHHPPTSGGTRKEKGTAERTPAYPPPHRDWSEKVKRQTEELSTPGMVRSPAMHEGFRLEDWTPIRTPSTPEAFLDADTSDDSLDEGGKETPSLRKRGTTAPRVDKLFRERSPTNILVGKTVEESLSSSSHETLRSSPPQQQPPTAPTPAPIPTPFTTKASIVYPGDTRRRSGELTVGFWNRGSNEGLLLGPPAPPSSHGGSETLLMLRKADSLRSFSPGSDSVFLSNERIDTTTDVEAASRAHLCSQCGERSVSREDIMGKQSCSALTQHQQRRSFEREVKRLRGSTPTHRARSEERAIFAKDWGMSSLSLEMGGDLSSFAEGGPGGDDEDFGVYDEAYVSSPWLYVSPNEELMAWRRDVVPPPFIPPHVRIPGFSYPENEDDDDEEGDEGDDGVENIPGSRASSPGSTCSEREFRSRYQAITHRMIHRKASVEMYRRIICGTFQTDKTVYVMRGGGEFGFRIHGSRPVVVSAIEGGTPAEASGLAVGDIVVAVNEINVLDASHSDVVRLAHSGNDTLRLDVARTRDLLTPLVTNDPTPVCAGYLYKLGGAHHVSGTRSIARRWRRRWFALKKDHCLYYYKSEMDESPLGALHLLNYSVHALTNEVRPFAFTVAKFGGTTLHLAARSEDARKRWGQMITQAALEAAQRDELIEESARRVQQSPGAIATPDCFGYLSKLGSRWHQQWKRRYCVLKDACLFFYHDTDATSAIGVAHLHGYRVQSTSIGGRKHAFELIPPETRFRHFFLSTDSDSDKKRWMAGLEYSIDRWIKAG